MEENKTINQFDPSRARANLIQMLSELSADALEYVWRPIVYAYYYTDNRDADTLTDDDSKRLSLIGVAAHGSSELVSRLNSWSFWLQRAEWEKARAQS